MGYHLLLLVAAAMPKRANRPTDDRERAFAIAIPAHDEEQVLPRTLRSLQSQEYPRQLFDVFVVADFCNDGTAEAARNGGAICLERDHGPGGRKAYALRWLLDHIVGLDRAYDGIVIFDADSSVDPRFLWEMNRAMAGGGAVLQGRHVIRPSERDRFGQYADVDMRLNNLLHNQAKQQLGLSSRLMGDAMCFVSEVIDTYGWPTDSLAEDREFGLFLVLQGIRTEYVRDAVSVGEAAPSWKEAVPQRTRWNRGAREIRRQMLGKLLQRALGKRDCVALDQAVELALPPYSLLTAVSVVVVTMQFLLPHVPSLLPLSVSLTMLLAWGALPVLGLLVDGAPSSTYVALLRGPAYLAWRLTTGVRHLLLGSRVGWERTRRDGELPRESAGERS